MPVKFKLDCVWVLDEKSIQNIPILFSSKTQMQSKLDISFRMNIWTLGDNISSNLWAMTSDNRIDISSLDADDHPIILRSMSTEKDSSSLQGFIVLIPCSLPSTCVLEVF